jgi:hypothetical protein
MFQILKTTVFLLGKLVVRIRVLLLVLLLAEVSGAIPPPSRTPEISLGKKVLLRVAEGGGIGGLVGGEAGGDE